MVKYLLLSIEVSCLNVFGNFKEPELLPHLTQLSFSNNLLGFGGKNAFVLQVGNTLYSNDGISIKEYMYVCGLRDVTSLWLWQEKYHRARFLPPLKKM